MSTTYKLGTALSVCIVAAGCGGGDQAGRSVEASTTATSATVSTTTPAPLAEAALDGLLLGPAEIDSAMGATGMKVAASSNKMANDVTAPADAPKETTACIGIAGTAEAQAYAGSGSTAVRDQVLKTPQDSAMPLTVDQAVILFDSAERAAAFVSASAEQWPACTRYEWGGTESIVGPVSDKGGMLSTTITLGSGDTSTCERALTAANNVAIDIATCGAPGSAVSVADKITAKVKQ